MTLLIMEVVPDHAFVFTDTLVDTPAFMTKFSIVSHLELLVAGTGLGNLLSAWASMLNSMLANGMPCRDIDDLVPVAEQTLPQLWDAIHEGRDPQDNPLGCRTASIYHVGRTADRGYVAYAYQSREGFVHTEISPCFMVKPAGEGTPTPTPTEAPESLEEIIELADRVHADQRSVAAEEQIGIGGELIGVQMRGGGISIEKVHRFDDYDDAWTTITAIDHTALNDDSPAETGPHAG